MGIDIPVIWFSQPWCFATLMYIVMDGFDLGIGIVFSFVPNANESATCDEQRRPPGVGRQ